MILHIFLILTMLAPPSEEAARAAFNDGALSRALEMFRERAQAPGVHPPDALAGAHDCLRALHRSDPTNVEHICSALELTRAVLARDDLRDDDERAFWAELETQDAALAGGACSSSKPHESAPADSTPAASPSTSEVKPEGPAPLPGVKDSSRIRPAVRVAAGSSVIAVGLGLIAGMAGPLVRRRQADATIAAINAELTAENRPATPAEHEAVAAADRRYLRLERTAAVLATVGIVTVLTGLAVALSRPRAASRARAHASAAGLVYSF